MAEDLALTILQMSKDIEREKSVIIEYNIIAEDNATTVMFSILYNISRNDNKFILQVTHEELLSEEDNTTVTYTTNNNDLSAIENICYINFKECFMRLLYWIEGCDGQFIKLISDCNVKHKNKCMIHYGSTLGSNITDNLKQSINVDKLQIEENCLKKLFVPLWEQIKLSTYITDVHTKPKEPRIILNV